MKRMIFHIPSQLDPKALSASGIRPRMMLNAFIELGYEVAIISGYSDVRKRKINQLIKKIKTGTKFDLLYSESTTLPVSLTDKNHIPLRPFIDYRLFRICNDNNIPIGLFYRDIYWLFPVYSKNLPFWKTHIARIFHRYDLKIYEKFITKLYLPSMKMKEYIPIISTSKFDVLPPAHNGLTKSKYDANTKGTLNLFYVGGIGAHYQMVEVFKALQENPNIKLTLCTRKTEWIENQSDYLLDNPELPNNINVMHASGKLMEKHLLEADIALIYVKPIEYWEFALPLKLFEYIGFGKPIIASEGTYTAEYIKTNNLGWSINYHKLDFSELLNSLLADPMKINEKAKSVQTFSCSQTWTNRAKQVVEDLF